MLRIIIMMLVINITSVSLKAQDQLFPQFYNSPLNLNPAFTGTSRTDLRTTIHIKRQWHNAIAPLQAYSITADECFDNTVSAAVIFNYFSEGYINTISPSIILAKNFGVNDDNLDREWFFNFAIQAGKSFRAANRNRFLFPDQINQNGINGQQSQVELFTNNGKWNWDFSTGALLTYKHWMLGCAFHHIYTSNIGLIGNTDAGNLPFRYTIHLSYMDDHDDQNDVVIKPTAIFQSQGVSKQISLGGLFHLTDTPLDVGIWYTNTLRIKDSHGISIGINLTIVNFKEIHKTEEIDRLRVGGAWEMETNRPYTGGNFLASCLYEKRLWYNCPKLGNARYVKYPWQFH